MPYKDPSVQRQKQIAIERSLEGLLVLRYRCMRNRVKGKMTASPKYFIGRDLMSYEAFLEWSLIDENYLRIHREWEGSGYSSELSPSIDRWDSNKGYTLGNIEWVTTEENSKRGRQKYWKCRKS